MKTEFLKAMGLTDEQIADIMKENGKDVEAAKAKFSDYDDLKKQLGEANDTIKSYTDMDIEGIKKSAKDWEEKAVKAEREAAEKIADMEFNNLLSSAISEAKGKNPKALRGLLDLDVLKGSKNQTEDIKAALAAVKETDGYLFEDVNTPPPYAGGTGSAKIDDLTKETFAKMGYRERVELKNTNPEKYEALRSE